MAILDVYNVRDGASSDDGDQSRRTYRYKVETDDATHDPDICWTSSDIPAKGSTILRTGLPTLIVVSRRAEHNPKSPYFFDVTVEAEERQPGADTAGGGPDPEAWDVVVSIDGVPYEEPLQRDVVNEDPVVNSAGQPFDPPIMETYFDEKIEVSFKTMTVRQSLIRAARGRINSKRVVMNVNGYVRTFEPYTLWLANATQRSVVRAGGADPYWEVGYVFIYREDGWQRRPVDMGFYTLSGGSLKPILDANNEPVTQPAYLDGSGGKLAGGSPAVRLSFAGKAEANFLPLFAGL